MDKLYATTYDLLHTAIYVEEPQFPCRVDPIFSLVFNISSIFSFVILFLLLLFRCCQRADKRRVRVERRVGCRYVGKNILTK